MLRVVPNLVAAEPGRAEAFYGGVLGMRTVMDMGWVRTYAGAGAAQVTVASEGGQGATLPAMTVEVDDLDTVHRAAVAAGYAVEYGPLDEPWGVRRFFVRDPFGTLLNVMEHGGSMTDEAV